VRPDLPNRKLNAFRGHGLTSPRPGPFRSPSIRTLLLSLVLATLLISLFNRPAPAAPSGSGSPVFDWPCQGQVSIPFRPARGPYGQGGHAGIDIAVPAGTPVRASAPGRVTFSGNTPVGLCVTLDHGSGLRTTYVSLQDCTVRTGMDLGRGAVLGKSDGSQDRSSTLPHLHFGASLNGVPIDPMLLLEGKLLDPSRDLFLGPWEDQRSIEAWMRAAAPRDKGILRSITDAVGSAARAVTGALERAWDTARSLVGKAIGLFERGAVALWEGCKVLYRECIKPLAVGLGRAVLRLGKAIFFNRYVQAALAALAAVALITLAVLGAAFTFGISLSLAFVAIGLAAVACGAYATYYAASAGDSFSFLNCFTGCLVVGGTVAVATLTVGQSWALLSAGWKEVGLLGFGKSFLAHGLADALATSVVNAAAGRPFSLKAFALSFLAGGLMGAGGKIFVTGLSQSMMQGMAAGAFAVGQSGLSSSSVLGASLNVLREGGAAGLLRFAAEGIGRELAAKLTYMAFCGSAACLTDLSLHLATGRGFTLGGALISFGAGACMGGIGVAASTLTPAGILRNALGVGGSMGSEFVKGYVKKALSKGGKELVSGGDGKGMGPEILPGSSGNR